MVLLPIHLAWTDSVGANTYHGADWTAGTWIDNDLVEGVLQPGSCSDIFSVVVQNMAQERRLESVNRDGPAPTGTPEKFVHVKLYLDADDSAIVDALVQQWPDQNAGVELSFDHGNNWQRICSTWGNPSDSSTWILLPGIAVTEGSPDGELGPFPPFNRATIQVRIKTPQAPAAYGLFPFRLVPDYEVL